MVWDHPKRHRDLSDIAKKVCSRALNTFDTPREGEGDVHPGVSSGLEVSRSPFVLGGLGG